MLRVCLLATLTCIAALGPPAAAQDRAPERQADGQNSAALADALAFEPSPELRRQVYDHLVQQRRQTDPAGAQVMETAFQADPISQWAAPLATIGLQIDNLADAYTMLWLELWKTAHGASDTITRDTARSVRLQAARAITAMPALAGADDARKQRMSDMMLVQAMLIGGMRLQAGTDPARQAALRQEARNGGRELGLDLDAMVLTAAGFVLHGAGGANAVAATPTPTPTPTSAAPQGGGRGEAALAEALAAVPADARPQQVVLHGEGSFLGWPPAYVYTVTTHLLFPNGWATRCADWDPGVLRPTPESLGRAYPDCGLSRWRRSGSAVQVQEEDGSWGEPIPTEDGPRPFTPGERIDIAFGNVGGVGFAGAPGGVSVNSLGGSDLRLTPDGQIAIGSWSSVVVSGEGIGGGGSAERGPLTGNYRLDGNLIAIQDGTGAITRGFIAGVPGTGALEHVYLNGKQFWEEDD